MSNQPLDKGRVVVIAEKYQDNQGNDKNRYATVGRATKWPNQNGQGDNVDMEIDTMPVNSSGPIKMYIFWDSEQQNNLPQNNSQGYNQQQPQQGYQPQNNGYAQGTRG